MGIYSQEDTLRGRGVLAKPTNRILGEDRSGDQILPGRGERGGSWLDIKVDQVSRVTRYSGRQFLAELTLKPSLLKLDFTRNCTDGLRRSLRSLTKIWPSRESLSPLLAYFLACRASEVWASLGSVAGSGPSSALPTFQNCVCLHLCLCLLPYSLVPVRMPLFILAAIAKSVDPWVSNKSFAGNSEYQEEGKLHIFSPIWYMFGNS